MKNSLVSFNGNTHSNKDAPGKTDMAEAFHKEKKILKNSQLYLDSK